MVVMGGIGLATLGLGAFALPELLVIGAVSTGAATYAWLSGRRQRRRRQLVWATVADIYGGEVLDPADPDAAEVVVDGVAVHVESVDVRVEGDDYTHSCLRATARYLWGAGPVFTAQPEPGSPALIKALTDLELPGALTVPLATGAWVAHAAGRVNDVAVWGAGGLTAVLERGPRRAFAASDGERVAAVTHDARPEVDDIRALVELCSALARSHAELERVLDELPDCDFVGAMGAWDRRTIPCARTRHLVPVSIGPRVIGRTPVMCAWAPVSLDCAPFLLSLDGETPAEAPEGAFAAGALANLPAARAAAVAFDGEIVQLRWAGLERSPARLLAGARAVAAYNAGPSDGAFR